MSFLRKAILSFSILPLLTLPSCVYEADDSCPEVISDEVMAYLELTVTTGGNLGTRSNPTGGEIGDGYEHGQGKENAIYDLNIFLYRDNNNGLDGNYYIRWSKYVDSSMIETGNDNPSYNHDRIYNVKIPLNKADLEIFREYAGLPNSCRCIVVANTGDIFSSVAVNQTRTKTIVDNVQYGKAWIGESTTTADRFVMSPAFNGVIQPDSYIYNEGLINVSTGNDGIVYSTEITLERVAARIDLQFSNNSSTRDKQEKGWMDSDNQLRYKVKNVEHTLSISNIIPVNLMQQNSYLLKHISDGENINNVLIAADETLDGQKPTNYVISPCFNDKGEETSEAILSNWYGKSSAGFLRKQNNDFFLGQYEISDFSKPIDIPIDSYDQKSEDKALIITYANENTHPEEIQVLENASDYLTGLLFRAQYHPSKVYTTGDIGDDAKSEDYVDGNDFWLFRTVGAYNTNIVDEKYNLYFSSEDALNEYVATLPGEGKYETVYYPGGICYYNVWIKHANIEDSDENFPMKYGIVRNNIYRIKLSFNGIGQPKPEITEPRNVNTRIYVIKWNFRPQPEIIM